MCEITSVGLPTLRMTLAIVNVLPVPVAPSSVWYWSPRKSPSVSSPMARGWSPIGGNAVESLNGESMRWIVAIRGRGGAAGEARAWG